jgi:hypothetical protein
MVTAIMLKDSNLSEVGKVAISEHGFIHVLSKAQIGDSGLPCPTHSDDKKNCQLSLGPERTFGLRKTNLGGKGEEVNLPCGLMRKLTP